MDVVQPNAFPSLAALRAAHNTLLLAHRERGNDPTFAGEILTFLQQGQATGAVLDSEDERKIAQSLLDYWTATLLSAGQQPPDALLADFDPSLAPLLADDLCPYVGLDAFGEQKSGVFFGRQRLAKAMIDHLTQARLLAVVGPSGSGKSSLVLAGLVPALKSGAIASTEEAPDSSAWRYLPRLVPGSDPLGNLSRAIQPGKNDLATLDVGLAAKLAFAAEGFRRESNYLAELINAIYPQPVVIVVDQFEEIFTLGSDVAVCQAFIDNLLKLTQAAGPRHSVILTMRTDFESFIARLSGFQSAFEQALVRVTPLNAAELRESIEKPAAMIGLKFEDGLVDALLQDILGEPAALPLLQFTLLRLWENRDHNRITWAAYKRLGGGRLALANSADELYNALIPEEQLTARRIFMRLVRPGEGLEITSNRVRRATLYQTGEARDRVDRVLQKLIDAHLLRVSEGDSAADTQIEVAHEALVRNWPRLVQWLEEERETIRERLRLTAAAEQWIKLGRDPSALLRGALLEEAQRRPDLNELEKEFVQASQDALAAVIRAQEAARQHELEQAHALAEEQRQRAETERQWGEFQANAATRLRQRNLLLTIISILAGVVALIAIWSSFQAAQNERLARENASTAVAALTEISLNRAQATEANIKADLQQATAQAANAAYVEVQRTVVANSTEDAQIATQLRNVLNVGVGLNPAAPITPTVSITVAATDVSASAVTPTRPYLPVTPTPTSITTTVVLTGAGVKGKLWQPGQTLHIRFLDGDTAVQDRVIASAQKWTEHANIHFAFDNDPEAQIRISFKSSGSWSYIGTDALIVPQSQPTMNFGWLTPDTETTEYDRVVLKEFGHALGLVNEYQNPNANIPWNKEAVYRYYEGPPNNWTQEQVDANFFTRYKPEQLAIPKAFDPQSIMMYPIPKEFTDGEFFVGWNTTLSELDKKAIGELYPFQ